MSALSSQNTLSHLQNISLLSRPVRTGSIQIKSRSTEGKEYDPTTWEIAKKLYQYRCPDKSDGDHSEQQEHYPDIVLDQINKFVLQKKPVEMHLIGFTQKNLSTLKTFGSPHADKAEELSVEYLGGIVKDIKSVYPHGAKMIISSEAALKQELYGFFDKNGCDTYVDDVRKIIKDQGLEDVMFIRQTPEEALRLATDSELYAKRVEKAKDKRQEEIPGRTLFYHKDLMARIDTLIHDEEQPTTYLSQETKDELDRLRDKTNSSGKKLSVSDKKRLGKKLGRDTALAVMAMTELMSDYIRGVETPDHIALSIHHRPLAAKKVGIFMTPGLGGDFGTPAHNVATHYLAEKGTKEWRIGKITADKDKPLETAYKEEGAPSYLVSREGGNCPSTPQRLGRGDVRWDDPSHQEDEASYSTGNKDMKALHAAYILLSNNRQSVHADGAHNSTAAMKMADHIKAKFISDILKDMEATSGIIPVDGIAISRDEGRPLSVYDRGNIGNGHDFIKDYVSTGKVTDQQKRQLMSSLLDSFDSLVKSHRIIPDGVNFNNIDFHQKEDGSLEAKLRRLGGYKIASQDSQAFNLLQRAAKEGRLSLDDEDLQNVPENMRSDVTDLLDPNTSSGQDNWTYKSSDAADKAVAFNLWSLVQVFSAIDKNFQNKIIDGLQVQNTHLQSPYSHEKKSYDITDLSAEKVMQSILDFDPKDEDNPFHGFKNLSETSTKSYLLSQIFNFDSSDDLRNVMSTALSTTS